MMNLCVQTIWVAGGIDHPIGIDEVDMITADSMDIVDNLLRQIPGN
jgi:hypothetical protein